MKSVYFAFLLLAASFLLAASCKKESKPSGEAPPADKFQAKVDGQMVASDSSFVAQMIPSWVVSTGISTNNVKMTLQMNYTEISGTTYTTNVPISQVQINYYNELNQVYNLSNAEIIVVEHDTIANYVKVLFSGEFIRMWAPEDVKAVSEGLIQLHY